MDRYLNDTHSLYYNVDHSSMYGANLSTVFADGPPPLEEENADEDHGEFVFSPKSNAIGEAVLNKFESKLQKDAEEKPVGEIERPNFDFGSNSSAEKFEAFADFTNATQFHDTSSNDNGNADSNCELNGFKPSLTCASPSDDGFNNDDFGDFTSGFAGNGSSLRNGESDHEFGAFSATDSESKFSNELTSSPNEHVLSEEKGEQNDNEFADFEGFGEEDYKLNNGVMTNSHGNDVKQESVNASAPHTTRTTVQDNASDDEFNSFAQANDCDFGKFETSEGTQDGSVTSNNPDVIPANESGDLVSAKLPHDLTNHEKSNNDRLDPLNTFKDDSFKDFKSTRNNFENFSSGFSKDENAIKMKTQKNSEVSKADNAFSDFTSSSDVFGNFSQTLPSTENHTTNDSLPSKNEIKTVEKDVPKSVSNIESTTASLEGNSANEDDDFGDFADFSNDSFSAFSSESGNASQSKNSDVNFGSFTQPNEHNSEKWGTSNFGAFSDNAEATIPLATAKVLPKNSLGISTKNSDNFGAFSESSTSKNKQEFQANFGTFAQNFPHDSLSKTFPTKQSTGKLVSLYTSFQDVYVTLRHTVEDLERLKISGGKSMKEGKIWRNLHSNMGEGTLRFNWEQCKIADKICKALDVSKKNIVVNSNIVAMNEGLEIPVFAAGLGILQPSIAPSPTKKTSKNKQSKQVANATSSWTATPPPSSPQQTTFSESKTENVKDNSSDTASLQSNSDTASLDLDFFASAPSPSLSAISDQNSSNSLYNLDFAFGSSRPFKQAALTNNKVDATNTSKAFQDDPLEILKKLDATKMSSSLVNEDRAELSPRAMEIIERFDDLSFMHSTVLMFPLSKNN